MRLSIQHKSLGSEFALSEFIHPSTGKPNAFAFAEDGRLFEIMVIERPHSSLFHGENVLSDGTALFTLPFNPVYLILTLRKEYKKELFQKNDFFYNTPFAPYKDYFLPYIQNVCKVQSIDGGEFCGFDDGMIDEFLIAQTKKLLPTLKKSKPVEDFLLIESAWDIMRHYLTPDFATHLKEVLKPLYPGSFPIKTIDQVISRAPQEKETHKQGRPKKKNGKSVPEGNKTLFDFMQPKKVKSSK